MSRDGSDYCPLELQKWAALWPLEILERNWNDTSPEFIERLEHMRIFERKLLRGEHLSGASSASMALTLARACCSGSELEKRHHNYANAWIARCALKL